jgi:hypothetical protein
VASALGIGLVAIPPVQAEPLESKGYRRIALLPDGDVVVYRPPAPRFQVVRRILRAADEEESFGLVTAPGFDPGAAVVLEEDPRLSIGSAAAEAGRDRIAVVLEQPERIELTATLATPGLLVIADTYFPGWQARVDGAPAPLMRANYAFRAVPLAGGTHAVELLYRPRSFRLGVVLSLLGLAITGTIWVAGRAAR